VGGGKGSLSKGSDRSASVVSVLSLPVGERNDDASADGDDDAAVTSATFDEVGLVTSGVVDGGSGGAVTLAEVGRTASVVEVDRTVASVTAIVTLLFNRLWFTLVISKYSGNDMFLYRFRTYFGYPEDCSGLGTALDGDVGR